MTENAGPAPSADDIRRRLLDQVDRFCAATGMSRTDLGRAVTGDKDVIHRISKGENTTFKSYEKIRRYVEENWPNGQSNVGSGVEAGSV